MKIYTISWEMPYQGRGIGTSRSESYEKAADAYRQLISVQCEPGCTRARATRDGNTVTARQLRAWGKIK